VSPAAVTRPEKRSEPVELAATILDPLLHRTHVLNIKGRRCSAASLGHYSYAWSASETRDAKPSCSNFWTCPLLRCNFSTSLAFGFNVLVMAVSGIVRGRNMPGRMPSSIRLRVNVGSPPGVLWAYSGAPAPVSVFGGG
jgi:hypothetical protein